MVTEIVDFSHYQRVSHIIRLGIGGPNLHIGMAFEDIERDVRVEHRRVHFTRLSRCGQKW